MNTAQLVADRALRRLTRVPGALTVWNKIPIGSVQLRVRYGVFQRPHYAYGVFCAADLAKRLGIGAISIVEFGVAAGRGLLALEDIARQVEQYLDISIHVVGFDSGCGMPEPKDYRDMPHVWGRGFYPMDEGRLRSQLSSNTELIIGDVAETVLPWLTKRARSPVGFVSFDLDYYSSTRDALAMFDANSHKSFLPRVYCYFDDVVWPPHACHNEYIGELRAIREFNEAHEGHKLCQIHMLRYMRTHADPWNEQMYVLHDFAHPLYCKNITPANASEIP
jgi:hypothetical protein